MPLRLFSVTLLLLILFVFPAQIFAQDIPPEANISGIIPHAQRYNLSCEARSAADWAAYWGVVTSEDEILSLIPRSDNPERGFVGDPNGTWGAVPPASYGVHPGPIAQALQLLGLPAEVRREMNWDEARRQVASGSPVIVWIIGQMWNGVPLSYTTLSGELVKVARYEHTMILTGYSPQLVYVADAYTGLAQTYPLQSFLNSWSVLGNQAIVFAGSSAPDVRLTLSPDTYAVQRGDYLSALAVQLDLDWRELAAINQLSYPYTIYPGQVLKLPMTVVQTSASPSPTPRATSTPRAARTPTPAPTQSLPAQPSPTLSLAAPNPTPTSASASLPDAYTVQRGDYLVALSRRFGMDWMFLAQLNGIGYPYLIYPGQVLRLR